MDLKRVQRDVFRSFHTSAIDTGKAAVADAYIETIRDTLKDAPYSYSEKICKDVAEGIVHYGSRLMCNETCDDSDEHSDDDCERLNQLGDDMLATADTTALVLRKDWAKNTGKAMKLVRQYYPLPKDLCHVRNARASGIEQALDEINDFLRTKAARSFTAAIVLIGEWSSIFGQDGDRTPLEIIEEAVQDALADRLTPSSVDLVVPGKKTVKVSTVKADGIIRLTIVP